MIKEDVKLKSFEKFRKETIDLLDKELISKDEFLYRNLSYIERLDLKPFNRIDSIDKAIYNYQYYNLLAKKSNTDASKLLHNPKKKKAYLRCINQRENYYDLKDIATLKLIEMVGYDNVESYFIKLRSKRLQGIIFEIYISSLDKVILHSKNNNILNMLRQNEVFDEEVRPSLIDSYVNKSY